MKVTEIYNSCKNYIFPLSKSEKNAFEKNALQKKALQKKALQKKALQKKAIRYVISIFITIIILLIVVYILKEVPHREVAQFNITNPKDLAEMENSYRVTLVQMLGGIAIGMGLYYTWRRVTIAENELKVSQQGQITERFTRAIDQLGSDKIEIRLGGIYALERISKESEDDYWPIMEILTAYIRKNSSVDGGLKANFPDSVPILIDIKANEKTKKEISEVKTVLLSIQAIATVIQRRRYSFGYGETNNLNLRRTNLQDIELSGADLSWADISEANLSGADLASANLAIAKLFESDFSEADLSRANLINANLADANLSGADLSRADLSTAFLYGANLSGADLRGADLRVADLSFTNLTGAHLEEADLKWAKDLTIDQLLGVKTLYKAELDENLRKQLENEHSDEYQALIKDPNE